MIEISSALLNYFESRIQLCFSCSRFLNLIKRLGNLIKLSIEESVFFVLISASKRLSGIGLNYHLTLINVEIVSSLFISIYEDRKDDLWIK